MRATPEIGDLAKALLRGESPWVECAAVHLDNAWEGRIDDKFFHEFEFEEQAAWLGYEWGLAWGPREDDLA